MASQTESCRHSWFYCRRVNISEQTRIVQSALSSTHHPPPTPRQQRSNRSGWRSVVLTAIKPGKSYMKSFFPSSGVAVVYRIVMSDCADLGVPASLQSTKPTDRKAVGCGSIEQHFILPASVEVVSRCMRRIEECTRKKKNNVVSLIGQS
nr:uncharacterized protein LOC115270319 [Aedes albopictus]